MKTILKTKTLIACSIITALTGCGDDYTPEVKENMYAPEHGGNIVVTLSEKEGFGFISALGTPDGMPVGEGVATDMDGDILFIRDGMLVSGDDTGISLTGPKVGVRPSDYAATLDTGDTETIELSYNISDGEKSVPRTMTINIVGEDAAPVVVGDLIGNFTKDAGTGVLDLLKNVSDADEEPLTVETSSVVADAANPFAIPFTIVDNMLNLDIAAIASEIPDGNKVTFKYTYTIKDHNNEVSRNMIINVLGVKDVAGAPLIANYFLTENIVETDGMLMVDLAKDIVEREGDAIIVSELMLDGVPLTNSFATRFEDNTLYFNPTAYLDDIAAGAFKEFTFTMKVSDDKGNMSDGQRELIVTVNGVESNLLVSTAGADVGFESDGKGFAATNCGAGTEISNSIVANGTGSLQMLGAPCYMSYGTSYFPDLEIGGKYYLHYNAYVATGDASPYIMIHNDASTTNHNFWVGDRPWHPANDSWRPLIVEFDTESGYLATPGGDGTTPIESADQLQLYVMSAWLGNDGLPVFDDFEFIRYDNIEGVDILTANAGSFEDGAYVPTTSGGGLVEVREDTNDATNKVLYVDTTGADEDGVSISFPIEKGSIVPGGRYRVTYDIQYLNFEANKEAATDPKINQWGGYPVDVVFKNPDNATDFTLFSTVWNGATGGEVQGVADEASHWLGFNAETDWNSDNLTVDFVLKSVGAQYIIDNIEIVRIP
ncbi:hypothetical protein [Colwellia echini]|uniref:Uncharacterized protein n=1 Tax=Colwellia echini TaxID=1982103 RepID=A0ABY3N1A1_9GAMM|nr:hypothetical protein [Colwellia echini]TYK67225.1 hypothetical protein CWS31_001485 [Colwellia echini]